MSVPVLMYLRVQLPFEHTHASTNGTHSRIGRVLADSHIWNRTAIKYDTMSISVLNVFWKKRTLV